MPRNSPKRREAKRQQLCEDLQHMLTRTVSGYNLENEINRLADAMLFVLEELCQKKQ